MPSTYTDHDIEVALVHLVLSGGNATRAVQELKALGARAPSATALNSWRRSDPGRYSRIQNEHALRVVERVASASEALAMKQIRAEEALTDRVLADIPLMKVGDAAAALRNVTTSKALQFDRVSGPIRGRPTVIVARRDPDQILNSLAQKFGISIDSTAEEIPAAKETAPGPGEDR